MHGCVHWFWISAPINRETNLVNFYRENARSQVPQNSKPFLFHENKTHAIREISIIHKCIIHSFIHFSFLIMILSCLFSDWISVIGASRFPVLTKTFFGTKKVSLHCLIVWLFLPTFLTLLWLPGDCIPEEEQPTPSLDSLCEQIQGDAPLYAMFRCT